VIRVIDNPPKGNEQWKGESPDPSTSPAPYKVYNIGNNNPIKLMDFIEAIEKALGKTAEKNMMPIQPGDVEATYANVEDLVANLDYKPDTGITSGINNFVSWYRNYFKV
jgi:UDP-glucuronate 4-epimerase